MPSFPQMQDLPLLVETRDWQWSPFQFPAATFMDFWLGIDSNGNQWLTKLRGNFKAYREIVFARLAQQMGWSCQTSVFIRIDEVSAKIIGINQGEIHAAHWFLGEHIYPPCNESCVLASLLGKQVIAIEDIVDLPIKHIIDWPKSEMAACLFGGTEPPGQLFTKEHEFVIIDSELMFASGPCDFSNTSWWGNRDIPSASGLALAKEVCEDFLSIGHKSLKRALALPRGVIMHEGWAIEPLIFRSFEYAKNFSSGKCGA